MKRREQLESWRAMTVTDLANSIHEAEAELVRHRFDHATRKLKDYSLIRRTRRRIAAMKTILREKVAASRKETM